MGREIRRVPPNWEHPKKEFSRIEFGRYVMKEDYQPMYDEPFGPAMDEWYAEWKAHKPEEHDGMPYWEYNGGPPDPAYYRPAWPEGSATWWQVYETVSEGAPVTPPFATREELVEYLVQNGDFWDQHRGDGGWTRKNAESLVSQGFAMSMVVHTGPSGVDIKMPRDGQFA
jgi:hypothetical protein